MGLPGQSYIPHLVEILAEPLERTNLWNEHQYLVNTTRALAKLLSDEREGLKGEIGVEEDASVAGEEELMVISPAISQLLEDGENEAVEAKPILVGSAVILTAISVEYNAVRSYLTELEEIHSKGTIYERGKFIDNGKFWEVFICQTGVGGINATLATVQAINYFEPDIVLLVGIAGGIKDVALGDVIVATEVYNYESGKAQEEFLPKLDIVI